jgi:hypothetical protein
MESGSRGDYKDSAQKTAVAGVRSFGIAGRMNIHAKYMNGL